MVNGYVRGQSDQLALSLLEELKYVLLQQENHIAKQAVEIERLNRENEQLRGDITRMKDDSSVYDEELMKSAPSSPESERKKNDERPNSEMKTDQSDDDEPKELVPKMIYRLNKDQDDKADGKTGSNSDLAEVINPQSIKEAKENIAKSISHATNRPTTFIQSSSHEMQKPPLTYDPTLLRQNPQEPPIIGAKAHEQHQHEHQHEQQQRHQHPQQQQQHQHQHQQQPHPPQQQHPGNGGEIRGRGRSESLPINSYNMNDHANNYQINQTTAFQRRAERQSLSRSSCSADLSQAYGPYVDQQAVYEQNFGHNFGFGNEQYANGNNNLDQNLRPVDIAMYHNNWPNQLGQGVSDQNYTQNPLTPNSITSNATDQSGDQPRARKLNENCRCQFCGKCFQVWQAKTDALQCNFLEFVAFETARANPHQ